MRDNWSFSRSPCRIVLSVWDEGRVMDKRISHIREARNKTMLLCNKLHWLFFGGFALYCMIVFAIVVLSLLLPFGSTYLGPYSVVSLLPVALNVFAGGYALLLIARILRAIGKGSSPFLMQFAREIKVLAIILLAGVVLGVFIEPGSQVGVVDESGLHRMTYKHGGNSDSDVFVDASGLLTSIICFALSTIFRYGAILQQEADDLV